MVLIVGVTAPSNCRRFHEICFASLDRRCQSPITGEAFLSLLEGAFAGASTSDASFAYREVQEGCLVTTRECSSHQLEVSTVEPHIFEAP